jgi:hypothetical protein
MTSKLVRAREAILQFIKTANPQDEFFVIGFNDRPELIEDFTSSVEEIQARLATVHAGHRTALLDAIYYGIAKMKDAHHERKALLVVSDGGDNRSRYTEGEVRAAVREADVEIYSIGIFDPYAPTPEERTGPQLLDDISSATGGRLFRVDDVDEMSDIAEKISTELRNQYVIGYKPKDLTRDGKWRKVKVKVNPPPGLPPLTVYARTGYYAPCNNAIWPLIFAGACFAPRSRRLRRGRSAGNSSVAAAHCRYRSGPLARRRNSGRCLLGSDEKRGRGLPAPHRRGRSGAQCHRAQRHAARREPDQG